MLSPKQALFVAEYLAAGLNATEAARRAGYKSTAAATMGCRLLAIPKVQAAIAERQATIATKLGVTAERIVGELARIAFTDRRGIATVKEGRVTIKDFDQLTPDEAACVEEVSQTITDAGGTLRVKMGDKIEALKLLAQHLGILDQGQVGVPVNAQIVVKIVEAPPRGAS